MLRNDSLVNTASLYKAYPIRTSYVCVGMSDSLRQELKPYQVRVHFRKSGLCVVINHTS